MGTNTGVIKVALGVTAIIVVVAILLAIQQTNSGKWLRHYTAMKDAPDPHANLASTPPETAPTPIIRTLPFSDSEGATSALIIDDGTGLPIANAVVLLIPRNDLTARAVVPDAHQGLRTDPVGRASIAPSLLSDKSHIPLLINAEGYVPTTATIPRGQETSVRLLAGNFLDVHVSDPAGAPVVGVRVVASTATFSSDKGMILGRAIPTGQRNTFYAATSGADGAAKLRQLSPGKYRLYVTDPVWVCTSRDDDRFVQSSRDIRRNLTVSPILASAVRVVGDTVLAKKMYVIGKSRMGSGHLGQRMREKETELAKAMNATCAFCCVLRDASFKTEPGVTVTWELFLENKGWVRHESRASVLGQLKEPDVLDVSGLKSAPAGRLKVKARDGRDHPLPVGSVLVSNIGLGDAFFAAAAGDATTLTLPPGTFIVKGVGVVGQDMVSKRVEIKPDQEVDVEMICPRPARPVSIKVDTNDAFGVAYVRVTMARADSNSTEDSLALDLYDSVKTQDVHLPFGKYIVQASAVGFDMQPVIYVVDEDTPNLSIRLSPSSQ